MAGICSGFVMRRTQVPEIAVPEIAGFVMEISASGHCGGCGAIKRDSKRLVLRLDHSMLLKRQAKAKVPN
jgi:hypothetical protein